MFIRVILKKERRKEAFLRPKRVVGNSYFLVGIKRQLF